MGMSRYELEELVKKLRSQLDEEKLFVERYKKFVLGGKSLTEWIEERCNAEAEFHHGELERSVKERTSALEALLQAETLEKTEWKAKAEALEIAFNVITKRVD